MDNLEKEVKEYNALQLACEFNRLIALAEEDDPRLVKLSDAKKLMYVEEELQNRKNKLLPGLPKPEPPKKEEPENANYMNVLLGSYYERKSKSKSIEPEKLLRFFVKVINRSLNTTIASIPVMASTKEEALVLAQKQSEKFGNKKLKFEVS